MVQSSSDETIPLGHESAPVFCHYFHVVLFGPEANACFLSHRTQQLLVDHCICRELSWLSDKCPLWSML